MIIKIIFGCIALYHLCWTGNMVLGFLALILLYQNEILSKLENK